MKTWVISDLHLGHRRLAEVRGFSSVKEHDTAFMEAWFDTVGSHDTVWLLGDIAFNLYGLRRLQNWPGSKKLCIGNHDKAGLKDEARTVYKSIRAYGVVDRDVLLAHMPVHPGSVSPRYRGQIHGHTHNRNVDDHFGRYFSVCPEKIGMAPILLSDAIAHLPARRVND